MLRITVQQEVLFRRAIADEASTRLAAEILGCARRQDHPLAADEATLSATSRRALELAGELAIHRWENIRELGVLMALAPERLHGDGAAMEVLKQTTLDEDVRIGLLREMGVLPDASVEAFEP